MLERCLKQYFLWENNNSSSVPGFSRVKLPIIILSIESTCSSRVNCIWLSVISLPVAFPLSNVTTSNASSAHKGSDISGKMTAYPFGGCLLWVVGRKERCRSCVGSQSWEAVGQAGTTVLIHKSTKWFGLEEMFKDHLIPSSCHGQGRPLLDQVALSPIYPGLTTHSGVYCLWVALVMFLPRAPDRCDSC